jgi:hypothetical protein
VYGAYIQIMAAKSWLLFVLVPHVISRYLIFVSIIMKGKCEGKLQLECQNSLLFLSIHCTVGIFSKLCGTEIHVILIQSNAVLFRVQSWINQGKKFEYYYNIFSNKNPGGARFSAPLQTGSGAHPASCTMDTGSFPGVKAAGA